MYQLGWNYQTFNISPQQLLIFTMLVCHWIISKWRSNTAYRDRKPTKYELTWSLVLGCHYIKFQIQKYQSKWSTQQSIIFISFQRHLVGRLCITCFVVFGNSPIDIWLPFEEWRLQAASTQKKPTFSFESYTGRKPRNWNMTILIFCFHLKLHTV